LTKSQSATIAALNNANMAMKKVGIAFDKASVRSADMGSHVTGIYAITAPSGSKYIGSAVDFGLRWKQHLYHLRAGKHHNAPLQKAYAKYGEAALVFSKLLICSKENLLMYEQIVIDATSPEYNICRVAGSQLGVKKSAETRLKMSASQLRRPPRTAETKEKIRLSNLGRIQSAESKEKTTASLLAYWSSPSVREEHCQRQQKVAANPETRAKISAALKGRTKSEEVRARMSAAKKGRPSDRKGIPRTEEAKANISAGLKAFAERKRNAQVQ